MEVSVCIPARLNSSRFPKKVLADLCGKPVLQHVFDRVCTCLNINHIYILSDSEVIKNTALEFGADVIETSDKCNSGTERIVSVLDKIEGDFIINVQGDEPFFDIGIIERILVKSKESKADIFTPIFKFKNMSDVSDPNYVKVVINYAGQALYFSRSVIPFVRDERDSSKWMDYASYYGHVGIYGYRRSVLEQYNLMNPSELEYIEKLEQLRFLENGFVVDTVETLNKTIGIDTPEDLEKARQLLKGK